MSVGAFAKCARLRSVTLNEGLEQLGAMINITGDEASGKVFMESGLESVRIPSTLKVIEQNTFADCEHLKTVDFAEGLEKIDVGAFRGSAVECVVLPTTMRTVTQAAFAKCRHLRRVVLNEGLEAIGTDEYDNDGDELLGAFHYSTVEVVCLPSTLRRIEYGAFRECKNLRRVVFPNKLEYIGRYGFFKSGIEEVTFPPSLKEVRARAFQFC